MATFLGYALIYMSDAMYLVQGVLCYAGSCLGVVDTVLWERVAIVLVGHPATSNFRVLDQNQFNTFPKHCKGRLQKK